MFTLSASQAILRRRLRFAFATLVLTACRPRPPNQDAAIVTQAATVFPAGFVESTTFANLTQPTALQFASDGRVFVAEKRGNVLVFDGLNDTTPEVFADLRINVHNFWDRGLLGLALHPQFPIKPYVYVLYTVDAPPGQLPPVWNDACPNPPGATSNGCLVRGRLSRLTANGNVMEGSEEILLEGWGQQYPSHSIGSLVFGTDGALYVSGGDGASFTFDDYGQKGEPINPLGDSPVAVGGAQTSPTAEGGALRSQSLRRQPGGSALYNGAVLRLDPETGAPLQDNPLIASADPVAQRIIASGLRNPYRMAARPGTNELWVADVGNGGWEEINLVANPTDSRLENFGWPCNEGTSKTGFAPFDLCKALYADAPALDAPFYAYRHSNKVVSGESCSTGSSAVTALRFYTGSTYPSRYQGALFFADYARNCAWAMLPGADGRPDPTKIETFGAGMSTPVDFQMGPQGDLYYVDIAGGAVKRVRYLSPVAAATATPTSGTPPLVVRFDGSASVRALPDDVLTYAWDLDGDGEFDDATDAQPTSIYSTNGNFGARLKVTDQRGVADISDVLTINISAMPTGSTPPVAVIDTPAANTTWKVGDELTFSGHATDAEEGALPATSLQWLLVMQHCPDGCHAHVVQTWDGVAGATLFTPDHEYPSHLQLVLVATDASGAKSSATLRLDPRTRWLTLQSSPPGLRLLLSGQDAAAPFSRRVIEGSGNAVGAPPSQLLGATTWAFVDWSDGGAATHELGAAVADVGLTARYRPAGLTGQYFDAKDLTVPKLVRTDATVNFDWGTLAPDPTLGADTFSVRWTGSIDPRFSETYTFHTDSDDGVRLWINGSLIINNWTDHAVKRDTGTVALVAGQKASVTMEVYDQAGGAVAKLWWSSAQQPMQIVPAERLWPTCATGDQCGAGLSCQAGACVDACTSTACTAEQRCEAGSCVDLCKDLTCSQGKCLGGKCVEPCTGVVCAGGERCEGGSCISACTGVSCPLGQVCSGGSCVDACLGINCPSPQVCQLAMCVDLCAGVMCPIGQVCTSGSCADACLGVVCPGQKCKLGSCVDLCTDVTCAASQKCVGGNCVDLCEGVVCPVNEKCLGGVCVDACQGVLCAAGERCASGECVPACTGVVCPQGQKCLVGACVSACTGVSCPAGQLCEAGSCVDACSVVTCGPGQVCQAGNCVDGCTQIQCPRGQICTSGACVDLCASITCDTGLQCDSGACVDPCVAVSCPAGQVCRGGTCIDGCAGVTCTAGQKCLSGSCVDACQGITCAGGLKCIGGECVPACLGVTCPSGQICLLGACVDACVGVTCPAGQKCALGTCIDACTDVVCSPGLRCAGGVCIDSCVGVTCPAGEICRAGSCVGVCLDVTCHVGQKCSGGSCVDGCQGVVCATGQKCALGACVDLCQGVACPAEQRCAAGACVDACEGVSCGGGQVCKSGSCAPGPTVDAGFEPDAGTDVLPTFDGPEEGDVQPTDGSNEGGTGGVADADLPLSDAAGNDGPPAPGASACSCDLGRPSRSPPYVALLGVVGFVAFARRRRRL